MASRHYTFVVGCQRSGTTLMGQIMGAHPRAVLIDEDHGVYKLIEAILSGAHDEEGALQRCLAGAHAAYVDRSRFTAPGFLSPSVTHLVFKAPNITYDFERLRAIHHPRMHFIFAVRDARDVVCSMRRLVHISMVENQLQHVARYGQLATRFAEDIQCIQHPDTADHVRRALIWKIKSGLHAEFTRPPLNAFLVRYEDLVSAPNDWIRRLLDHVGLDTHSEASHHHEDVFRGQGPGFTVRAREIDKTSVGRWKRNLTAEQEQDVWEVAGGLMKDLAYQRHPCPERVPGRTIPRDVLSRPVVATGRGGSGTRLLARVLQEHDVFLGNRSNSSEDSLEWVDLIYELSMKKLTDQLPASDQWRQDLTTRAGQILAKGRWQQTQSWGWKLPETMLIVPEVLQAFSEARIIHLVRHPLDTCLRRNHMTSRMETHIGAATLLAAYHWLNWDRNPRNDSDHVRNAASWLYQVDRVVRFGRRLGPERYLEVKYEDLCSRPQEVSDRIAAFLGKPAVATGLASIIDPTRRRLWAEDDDRAPVVWSICEEASSALGYRFPD